MKNGRRFPQLIGLRAVLRVVNNGQFARSELQRIIKRLGLRARLLVRHDYKIHIPRKGKLERHGN